MSTTEPVDLVADLGHLTTTYFESGAGEPLIILHGGEGDRNGCLPLLPYLGSSIRAISYDQRDSGEAVNSDDPYTVTDLANDLAAFMEQIGIERAHILGTSFGGILALHTAIEHPKHVASLTLIATTPSVALFTDVVRNAPAQGGLKLDHFVTPEAQADPELMALVQSSMTKRSPERMGRRLAAVRTHDVLAQLPTLDVPTLIVHGADDPLIPISAAESMADAIPGAILEIIEGGRHGITIERRAEVGSLVGNFVADHAMSADHTKGE